MAGLLKYKVVDGRGKSPSVFSRPDEGKSREVKAAKDGSFELHADDVKALTKAGYKCLPWNERKAPASDQD